MINKMLPYYGVIMKKGDVRTYPRYELKKGFSFVTYTTGMEGDWCRIQTKAGMVATWNEAKIVFEQKFKHYPELLTKYCVFIVNPENYAVATAALWPGKHFGKEHWRIHWVAVDPDYQGMGLGKVLITRLLDMFVPKEHGEWLYVTSQSWNYCAINIYYHFGFLPYTGVQPVNWHSENFAMCNKQGWALIDQYIEDYNYNDLYTLCLGDWFFQVITSEKELLYRLKRIFPMVRYSEGKYDGRIRFVLSGKQELTFDGTELNVSLNEENLYNTRVLRDVVWFYYHIQAAKEGSLLISKSQCEVITEGDGARLIFLRKKKYKEFDQYSKTDGLESFWEIFCRTGKYYIRDIQFCTCYRLKKMEWHVLRKQATMKNRISWQSFQNRMFAMAEQILVTRIPLLNNEMLIFPLPCVDDKAMQRKRNNLVKQLFVYTRPLEVIGISYRGEKDEGDCICME